MRRVRPGAGAFLGPFPDRRAADAAVAAVHESLPLRQCTPRLSLTVLGSACALAGMGRCGAPCTGAQSREEYASIAAVFAAAVDADPRPIVTPLLARVDRLAAEGRYEDAAVLRDRVAVLVRAVRRRQRLELLATVPELVLARPDGAGGWQLSVVRRGRLVAAGVAERGRSVRAYLADLRATAETPIGPDGELAASVDETELVLRWMEKPGTRLVDVTGTLASRTPGTGHYSEFLARVEAGRAERDPFADNRSLSTRTQPDRVRPGHDEARPAREGGRRARRGRVAAGLASGT